MDADDVIETSEHNDKDNAVRNDTIIRCEEEENSIYQQTEAKIDNRSQDDINHLHEDVNGTDTEEQGDGVTVYNADKVTDTDDSEVDHDSQEDFIGENNAEIDTFYSDTPAKLIDTGEMDDVNDEQSERVGLLMENAAQKMRNMSQRVSGSDDESHTRVDDTVHEGSCSDELPANETESLTCPLMQDQEQYELDPDDLRNVEC